MVSTNYDRQYVAVSSEIRNIGRDSGENGERGRLQRESSGEN